LHRILTATNEAGEALFPGIESTQIRPSEEGETIAVGTAAGKRTFIPTAEFRALRDDLPEKANDIAASFKAGGKLQHNWKELSRLIVEGNLAGTSGRLSKFISMDSDRVMHLTSGASEDAVRVKNLMMLIVTDTKRMLSKGHLEAMRGTAEVEVWKTMQGLIPTDGESFLAMISGETLENRVVPTFEMMANAYQRQFSPFFHGVKGWKELKVE
jgi:hypothetical protein